MVSATFLATILAVSGSSNGTLLYFTADWCGACQSTKPAVQRLASAGYPVREINVDREAELAAKFRVTAVPCFVLVADGQEIERVAAATSYARLVQMFERIGPPNPQQPPSNGVHSELVRGQTGERGPSIGLPRPLASLARNFGQRHEPAQRLVQIESNAPAVSAASSIPPLTNSSGLAATPPPSPRIADLQAAQSQPDQNEYHSHARQATVRLRVDDLNGHSVGTGTIIDTFNNEALIVTCGHIFRDSSGRGRIAVDLFADDQPHTVTGTLINYDLERDLGLVAIPAPTKLKAVRVAPSDFRFERGQEIFSVGCDRGADPSVRTSRITGIDRYVGPPNIEIAGQPVEGRSGGGLFSASGELIGVCNAADQSDNEGIFASLPAIHWELDRIGQRRIYAPKETELAQHNPRQADSLTKAVPERSWAAISPEPPRPAVAIQPLTPTGAPSLDDTEVICIVRSRANPQGSEKLLVLDRPSRELLDRLATESRSRPLSDLAQQSTPSFTPARTLPNVGPANSPVKQPIIRAQSNDR